MILGLQVLGILLLIGANAFFVASEFAVTRIRATQVTEFEVEGRVGAASLRDAVEHLDSYLAACQLGITAASVGLGLIAKPVFEQLLEPLPGEAGGFAYAVSFAAAFGLVTLLHVVLGELMPKSIAIARNTPTALAVALPLRLFYVTTRPVVEAFNGLGNILLRPFGVPPAREVGHAPHTETELRALLRQSLGEGLIEQSDVELAEGAFAFGDREVHEIMVPRPEIVALSVRRSPRRCLAAVVDSTFTRYPVYRESLDDIVGIVHVRDLFTALHDRGLDALLLEPLVRPAFVVPETKRLAELLADFRRTRQHLALVVDEYGAVVGLVTLEDLLEEIVGEIEDEYDVHEEAFERLNERRVRVEGTFPIEEFNESFGQVLPAEDFHTLGGFVFGALGRQPEPGDELVWDSLRFHVVDVEGSRVERVEVQLPETGA
jgi:CBS domain containing-hemolysin-like protein